MDEDDKKMECQEVLKSSGIYVRGSHSEGEWYLQFFDTLCIK